MRINPVVEESINLHFRTRQYRLLHISYVGILTLVTLILWPSRGFMEFFSTQTVPAAFEAIAVFQLMALSGISVFAGLDRMASSEVIRYSEWLEHTQVPIRELLIGKITAAVIHTIVLLAIGSPFLFISAGPGGIPLRAVFSAQWIMLLVALFSRMVGMLISLVGETRDVVRIVGSWLFLALFYLATIQILPPMNPIIAVVRQQNEESPLVSTVGRVPIAGHPALPSTIYLISGMVLVVGLFAWAMSRHRSNAMRPIAHD